MKWFIVEMYPLIRPVKQPDKVAGRFNGNNAGAPVVAEQQGGMFYSAGYHGFNCNAAQAPWAIKIPCWLSKFCMIGSVNAPIKKQGGQHGKKQFIRFALFCYRF